MTLCNWCGQESQNELNCDWCKRVIKLPSAAPAGNRVDLDFLRDAGDDKPGVVRVVAIVGCVLACMALVIFLLLSPRDTPQAVAESPPRAQTPGVEPSLPTRRAAEFSTAVRQGRDIEFRGPGGRARPTRTSPEPNRVGAIPTQTGVNSIITLDNVELSMVALQNGTRQVMGRADIVNPTGRNVVDFRCELVWGQAIYSMSPMTGKRGSMRKLDQRNVRPRGRTSVQLVSQPIIGDVAGGPSVLRLTAWLDGPPNNSIDDHLIQMGR